MARPRLLIDNDIFILLAGADLLEQAVTAVGFALADTRRLASLPHVVINKRSKVSSLPAVTVDRITQACKVVPILTDIPDITFLQSLTNVPAIDSGEALLYALLAEHTSYLLTSGDKRAMQAIAQDEALRPIRTLIAGRVICLETLLLTLTEQIDIIDIAQALTPVVAQNTTLRSIFTPNPLRQPASYLEGLSSYQQQLIAQVGTGFLWESP